MNLSAAQLGSELRRSKAQANWFKSRAKKDQCLRWFRSCSICASTLPPVDLMCESCWQTFETNMNYGDNLLQSGYPFPVYSLMTWNEPNDRLARLTIKGQKQGNAYQATRKLMELFSFQRQWPKENGLPIFVHPPSASGRPDHSALLATQLACIWGGLPLALQWKKSTKEPIASGPLGGLSHALAKARLTAINQKDRSATERSERRFEELDMATFTLPSTRWIFVDDVITTGATAMAAYMALGSPECFETWTLVCRPKLANQEGF